MKSLSKFYKLQNGYWLKVMITKFDNIYYPPNSWNASIVVAKTKRKANDHFNKLHNSPKNLENKSTNYKGGIESLIASMTIIHQFEKLLSNGNYIIIEGSDEQRKRVYRRLLRYGYKEYYSPWGCYLQKRIVC